MLLHTRRLVLLPSIGSLRKSAMRRKGAGFAGCFTYNASGAIACGYFLRLATTRSRISGVNMSSMARPIFPPGTTMVFGRDMNEL
ncbi:MAG: hypothetical protein K0S36_1129 [Nitrosospira multiformis]|nr:hypothetical protein [Nitrosospira multiformis]